MRNQDIIFDKILEYYELVLRLGWTQGAWKITEWHESIIYTNKIILQRSCNQSGCSKQAVGQCNQEVTLTNLS